MHYFYLVPKNRKKRIKKTFCLTVTAYDVAITGTLAKTFGKTDFTEKTILCRVEDGVMTKWRLRRRKLNCIFIPQQTVEVEDKKKLPIAFYCLFGGKKP